MKQKEKGFSLFPTPNKNLCTGKKEKGFTIIEVIIAICITTIISTLIFAAYLTIFKQFKVFTQRADKVMETVLAKKKIDALFKDVKMITGVYKTTLEYSNYKDKNNHILSFRSNALYKDNKIGVKGIKIFEYSVSEKKTKTGKNLLLWETVLLNGYWIGGAGEVLIR